MITEDYVSYEVAELLKEKGFNEQTVKCYNLKHELCKCQCNPGETINSTPNYLIAAPTLQIACKWLRDVHNLHVDVGYDDLDWFWNIISISEDVPIADRPKFIVTGTACHRTYEEAVKAAIKYTLENLI